MEPELSWSPSSSGLVQEPPGQVATPKACFIIKAPAWNQETSQGELLMVSGVSPGFGSDLEHDKVGGRQSYLHRN